MTGVVALNVRRFSKNPIIYPQLDNRIGANINGPSLIRVPDWVSCPLGRYYLYFAHHRGTYIRLAYADDLRGPWQVYSKGVLDLKDSYFDDHIASPDVRVRPGRQEIWIYYHGCCMPRQPLQVTRLAISRDGLVFSAREEILGGAYWRTFDRDGYYYTLEMPGMFRRSRNGITNFEEGPTLFTPEMRHAAVLVRDNTLCVFYSNAGNCPERILLSTVDLTPDWNSWKNSPPVTILKPETEYEGAAYPLVPSVRGAAFERVNQLRDPCIFEEDGSMYLLYSVAGESGIAIARLFVE